MFGRLQDRISSAAIFHKRFQSSNSGNNVEVIAGVPGMRLSIVSIEESSNAGGVVEFHFKSSSVTDTDYVSSAQLPPAINILKFYGDAAPVGGVGEGLFVDTVSGLRGVVQYILLPEA